MLWNSAQVEYDLVVIGASLEGIFAANLAASFKARVALINLPFSGHSSSAEIVYNRVLSQTNSFLDNLRGATQLGIYPSIDLNPELSAVTAFANEIITNLTAENSLTALAEIGVDVISGVGEFCRLPNLAFIVGKRKLRSRRYLIATGSSAAGKNLALLEKIGYSTTSDLWQKNCLESLPDRLAIIGGTPLALEIAQNLAKLGKKITLIAEDDRILPREDREIARLIQACLEAEGVRVFTNSPLTQVRSIAGQKWLQAGDRAIETDRVIFAGSRSPNIFGLNLPGVGIKFSSTGLKLDLRLRTTNPRIYACGDVAGGYPFPHLARYEANIAVRNALFLSKLKVDYRYIPIAIFTAPNLARVGMTEAEAKFRYGNNNISIIKQYFKTIAGAQINSTTTGIFKLISTHCGKILGVHIAGPQAAESIASLALAIKHNINLKAIANLPNSFTSYSEIIDRSIIEFQQQNKSSHSIWQRFLRYFFCDC
ncbi:MAG: NAD(P)/FAD-dependent oxidoreductase [Prochloraceae cyanobacterium]|nr:NAD(P)/FAD-dependent oxidoreductase [Prochloraceae cyanobacterium]